MEPEEIIRQLREENSILKSEKQSLSDENENYKSEFEKAYRVRSRFSKQIEKVISAFHTSTQLLAVKDLSYLGKEEDLESIFSELQSKGYIKFAAVGPGRVSEVSMRSSQDTRSLKREGPTLARSLGTIENPANRTLAVLILRSVRFAG